MLNINTSLLPPMKSVVARSARTVTAIRIVADLATRRLIAPWIAKGLGRNGARLAPVHVGAV